MQLDDNVRFSITLSKYDYYRLKKWAKIHGRSAATFAAQIVAARVEANFETINQQEADYTKWFKRSLDEVIEEEGGDLE